jgi:anti-sigma regulatory factor (Ser/Thr protein kinase)
MDIRPASTAVRERALRDSPFGGGSGRARGEGGGMRVELDAAPTAASEARAALQVLNGRVAGELLDDLRLLISELVSNSVRHSGAGPDARVCLEVVTLPGGVRVEVTDPGRGFTPRPRSGSRDEPGGWGLHLVERIAARWGVEGDAGTRVWFELGA